jgi:predicted transcriptional regulator
VRRADVTDAELSVLKELWALGPATIRELTDRLYPGGDTAHYATVQKLLERLAAKRCVRRRSKGRVNVFTATVDRSALIAQRLRDTAERLCEGSWTPLLTQLVGASSAAELSEADLAALRELVERRAAGKGGK